MKKGMKKLNIHLKIFETACIIKYICIDGLKRIFFSFTFFLSNFSENDGDQSMYNMIII